MRLLILGLLMEKNRHPYEIRQTIQNRRWHLTFKVRDGSLYYAVDQLREQGLIEVAETIPVHGDSRPDKTVYRITEAGKADFLDCLYSQMEVTAFPQHPLFMCMPFVQHGEPDRFAHLLEDQLEACRSRIEHIRAVLALKASWLPRGSIHLMEGMIMFSQTEQEWLERVLADAKSGKLAPPTPDCH